MNFGKLHETQDANKEGVGLGLSICKEIINAYGGSIDIQSTEGVGTDFIISLRTKCRVDEAKMKLAAEKIEQFSTISSSDVSQDEEEIE